MALVIDSATVADEDLGSGASKRRLFDATIDKSARTVVDRIALTANGSVRLKVPSKGVTYVQVLSGSVSLKAPDGVHGLEDRHVVFLPPDYEVTVRASTRATLLVCEVPDAVALDPEYAKHPAEFRVIDWQDEPLLDSVHDARKRIYLATPKLFGSKAIKAEMIIYPPVTSGANHYHEGADHFMYFTAGSGTAFANEQPVRVKEGDLVYFPDGERHYLTSDDGNGDMIFVEFFTPGSYETVWVNAKACSWAPTGKNIRGETASREIKAHSGSLVPEDV
jgi:quercetin dioxygenase-like cupin family protein